jgi:hypothetical protein
LKGKYEGSGLSEGLLWLFNGDNQLGLFANYKFDIRNFKNTGVKMEHCCILKG